MFLIFTQTEKKRYHDFIENIQVVLTSVVYMTFSKHVYDYLGILIFIYFVVSLLQLFFVIRFPYSDHLYDIIIRKKVPKSIFKRCHHIASNYVYFSFQIFPIETTVKVFVDICFI